MADKWIEDLQATISGFVKSRAQQAAAGLVEMLASDPNATVPIPGGITGLYGVLGMGVNALQKVEADATDWLLKNSGADWLSEQVTGSPLPRIPIPPIVPGVDEALDQFQASSKLANEVTGSHEPRNFEETMWRMAPSIAIPSPVKLGQAATAAQKVGQLGLEALLPLRQLPGAKGVAVAAAVPAAVSETINNWGENAHKDGYQSLMETLTGKVDRPDPIALLDQQLDDVTTATEIEQEVNSVNEQIENKLAKIGVGAAVLAGGLYGAKTMLRNRADARVAARQNTAVEKIAPTGGERVQTAVQDEFAALKGIFRDKTNSDIADVFDSKLSVAANPIAMNTRIDHTVRTGEFPTSVFSSPNVVTRMPVSPTTWYKDMAQLDTAKRAQLDELLEYGDELDNRRIAFRIHGQPTRTRLMQFDDAQLNAEFAHRYADPDLKRMADQYWGIQRSMLDYMKGRGLLTDVEWQNLVRDHSRYVPNFEQKPVVSGMEKFWRQFERDTNPYIQKDIEELAHRNYSTGGGLGTIVKPSEAMLKSVQDVLRFTELNDVRRMFFQHTGATPIPGNKAGNDAIRVRTPTGIKHYKVDDPVIRSTLMYQPQRSIPVFNSMRRAYQNMTTGLLQPLFSLRAFTYDALSLPAVSGTRKAGLLPAELSGIDVTALPGSVYGIGRGLAGNLKAGSSTLLNDSLRENGRLVQMFGQQNVQRLADVMASSYEKSTLSILERYGGVSGGKYSHTADISQIEKAIKDYAPELTGHSKGAHTFVRGYRALLDSVQNGARLHYAAMNYKPGMSEKDVLKLMKDVRDLTGDFAVQGSSPKIRGFNTASPYSNVMIQSLARHAKMMKDHPGKYASWIATGVVMPAAYIMQRAAELGPEYIDHMMNELTPEQRAGGFVWYHEGRDPQQYTYIPIPPEFGLFLGMATEGIDALMGYSTGIYKDPAQANWKAALNRFLDVDTAKSMASGAGTGLERTTSIAVPPPIAFGAGLAGLQFGPGQLIPREIQDRHIDEGNVSDLLFDEQTEVVITALTGALGRQLLETARSAERAYEGTESVPHAVEEGVGRFADMQGRMVPMANYVWQNNMPSSRFNMPERALLEYRNKMKEVSEVHNQITKHGGDLTRLKKGYETPGAETKPLDPADAVKAEYVTRFYNDMEKRYTSILNGKRTELDRLKTNPRFDHETRTRQQNVLVKELHDFSNMYLEEIDHFEAEMKKQFPDFSLREFNPR